MLDTLRKRPPALIKAFDAFLDSDEGRELSASTQDSYEYLKQYIPSRGYNIASFGQKEIDRICGPHLKKPGLYRRLRSALIRVSKFAVTKGWRDERAQHHAPASLKPLKSIPRWYAHRVTEALDNCDGDILAMIALVYFTGQRLVDVALLKPKHKRIVKGEDGDRIHFTITQQKTGDIVEPEITDELFKYLPDVPDDCCYIGGGRDALTAAVLRARWRRARAHLEIKGIRATIHGLRKDACCEAIEGGAELPAAQALMGHASPQSTAIYFKEANRSTLASDAFRARNTARARK